jgi:uncharacterized membrane protein
MPIPVLIHVVAGSLAIVAGYVAVFAAKGGTVHRRGGMLFVCAMVTMAVTGAVMAALRSEPINVLAGSVTAYLVITALTTVRRPAAGSRRLDVALMLMGLAVGLGGVAIGFRSLASHGGGSDGIPAPLPFIFGAIALLAGASDVRMIRSGGLRGVPRLRRHLWRMCFALFIAAGSFFLGQADEIPEPLRVFPLLAVPSFLPLLLLPYWLWRVRRRPSRGAAAASAAEAVARAHLPARAG